MKSRQSSKNVDDYEPNGTNACPICCARYHDTTRRRRQKLYDHLVSNTHTKADLALYLQMAGWSNGDSTIEDEYDI